MSDYSNQPSNGPLLIPVLLITTLFWDTLPNDNFPLVWEQKKKKRLQRKLMHSINLFHKNNYDVKPMTKFVTAKTPNPIQMQQSTITPGGNISGEGAYSHASTMGLLWFSCNFMILYNFFCGKSYPECSVNAPCFEESLLKNPLSPNVQRISVWLTDTGRWQLLRSPSNSCYYRKCS